MASAPILVVEDNPANLKLIRVVLTAAGYDASNVVGGTSAWIRAGHPIEK